MQPPFEDHQWSSLVRESRFHAAIRSYVARRRPSEMLSSQNLHPSTTRAPSETPTYPYQRLLMSAFLYLKRNTHLIQPQIDRPIRVSAEENDAMRHQHLLQHRDLALVVDLAGELAASGIADDVASEVLPIRQLHDLDGDHARSSAVDVAICADVEVAFESFDDLVRGVVCDLIHDLRALLRTTGSLDCCESLEWDGKWDVDGDRHGA